MLRSRSAADRGAVLRLAVLMLLALPLISLFFPALVVETAGEQAAVPPLSEAFVAAAAPVASAGPAATGTLAPAGNWEDPGILFLLLYAGGVIAVGGRLLAGLWTLRRWTAEAQPVTDGEWLRALDRAEAGGRHIGLLVSAEASSPLSWGLRNPVILLDFDALRRPGDADAILAHEVAHVVRADWLSLILSRLTVALFWFNPLVWRLDREVAHQAEEAADSHAAQRVEPARYAQTLLDWARQDARAVPANAMAGSEPGLSRRVRALLEGRFSRRSGSFWATAAMIACAAVAAPVAALEFVPEAPEAPEAPEPPEPSLAPAATPSAVPAPPPAGEAPPPAAAPLPALARAPVASAAPAPVALAMLQPHPPHPPHPVVDGQAIRAEVEAAVRTAAAARAKAHVDHKAIEEQVRRAVSESMRASAAGMESGAAGMETGARQMRAEAGRLRDPRYREEQIRKAAERGDKVTHEELIKAAKGMEEGAEGMLEGAREMRRSAQEMRRGG
jgi:beta-lactamase regulating signal transducer with metallopeptidase domain